MTEAYKIEEATRAKEVATAALYRPDGSKRFAEAEHREREQAIERDFSATMDRIEEAISERVGEAERELLVASNADPTRALTIPELEQANLRRAFVEEEVRELPPDRLARRARAAIASGDRVGMFLLSIAAGRRSDEELELGEVVAELRAALDPDAERKLTAARQAHEDAQELRERAYYKRRGVDDAFGLYAQSGYWTSSS